MTTSLIANAVHHVARVSHVTKCEKEAEPGLPTQAPGTVKAAHLTPPSTRATLTLLVSDVK